MALDIYATSSQNGCWTEFSPTTPAPATCSSPRCEEEGTQAEGHKIPERTYSGDRDQLLTLSPPPFAQV